MNKKFLLSALFSAIILSPFALQTNAETYDIMYGDINGDNTADISDLSMLSLHLIGDITLDETQLLKADVMKDGEVNIADMAHFKQYIMHEKGIRLGESQTSQTVTTQGTWIIDDDEFSAFTFENGFNPLIEINYPSTVIRDYKTLQSYDPNGKIAYNYGIDADNAEEYFKNNAIFADVFGTSGSINTYASSFVIDSNGKESKICMNVNYSSRSLIHTADLRMRTITASVPLDKLPDLENAEFTTKMPTTRANDIPIGGTIIQKSDKEYILDTKLGLFSFDLTGKPVDYCAVSPEELAVGKEIIVYTDEFFSESSYPVVLDKVSRIYAPEKDGYGASDKSAVRLEGVIQSINNDTIILQSGEDFIAVPFPDDNTKLHNVMLSELTKDKHIRITCSANIIDGSFGTRYVYQVESISDVLPVKYTGTLDSISKNEEYGRYNFLFEIDDYCLSSFSIAENDLPLLFNVKLDELKSGDRLEVIASPRIAETYPTVMSDVRAIKLIEKTAPDTEMLSSEYSFMTYNMPYGFDEYIKSQEWNNCTIAFETWEDFENCVKNSDGYLDILSEDITKETFEKNAVILKATLGISGSTIYCLESVNVVYPEIQKGYIEVKCKEFNTMTYTSDVTHRLSTAVIPKDNLIDADLSDIRIVSENVEYLNYAYGVIEEYYENRYILKTENGKISFVVSDTETVFRNVSKNELRPGDKVKICFNTERIDLTYAILDDTEPVLMIEKLPFNPNETLT